VEDTHKRCSGRSCKWIVSDNAWKLTDFKHSPRETVFMRLVSVEIVFIAFCTIWSGTLCPLFVGEHISGAPGWEVTFISY